MNETLECEYDVVSVDATKTARQSLVNIMLGTTSALTVNETLK